jgi:hypothetical protein
MLSTRNLPESKGIPKTIQPGNILAKINSVSLEDGYEDGTYHVILHLEGEDLGAQFEGFFVDKDNPGGARYKGQVGRVKISYYSFGWEINGTKVDRDEKILGALKNLSVSLGKQEALNDIKARTIEEFVPLAAKVLSGELYINWCIGGREYLGKDSYTKYDLFLPKPLYKNIKKGITQNEFPYEKADIAPASSNLMKFDPARHIVKKKTAAVSNFQPAPETAVHQSEFDLE